MAAEEQQTGFPWARPATIGEAVDALGCLTDKINAARLIAVGICVAKGCVASYEVLRVMRERGLVPVDERCYWVSRVFGHPMFAWTGDVVSYRDRERNVHESTVQVWKLREDKEQ